MKQEKLTLTLLAPDAEFVFSLRSKFTIAISVTNEDDKIIDPELHLTNLMVNGKESVAWMEAISNGHRSANWFSLPPGQSVSISWSTLGQQLFPSPGEYILQIQLRAIKSPAVKVTVLPD